MIPTRSQPLFIKRTSFSRVIGPFSPDELARQEIRRRLLRYIIDTHYERLAHRGHHAALGSLSAEG